MCGIVGVLGSRPVAGSIIDALRRLEYRGYDSAGVATLENGKLERRRAEKGNYRHFMAKEIHEQPEVVGHTLARYVDMAAMRLRPFAWAGRSESPVSRFD